MMPLPRVGRIKWDSDDMYAINTMRTQILTLDSEYRLNMITTPEYQKALADIVARVEALEAKYGLR